MNKRLKKSYKSRIKIFLELDFEKYVEILFIKIQNDFNSSQNFHAMSCQTTKGYRIKAIKKLW